MFADWQDFLYYGKLIKIVSEANKSSVSAWNTSSLFLLNPDYNF